MEDVLDVYMRPYDPLRPQVSLDETSIQLVREKRIPLPMAPGRQASRPSSLDWAGARRTQRTQRGQDQTAADASGRHANVGQPYPVLLAATSTLVPAES